jgi:hypothetical protein
MALSSIIPSGVGTAFQYGTQTSGGPGYTGIISATPPPVNTPAFYEPYPPLSQNELVLWIVVSGTCPNFGGAQVWASVDGTTYGQLGFVGQGGVQGVLTGNYASHSDPDTVDTLSVDTSESCGVIPPGSTTDADLGLTLALVDQELIGYSASTLVSTYNYNLGTYIRRGQYGSSVAGHLTGAPFALLNGSVFKYEYPQNLIGKTIFFKFPSFNIVGGGLEDISTVTVYSYTLTGVGSSSSGGGVLSCPVITVLAGGACCVVLGVLGECVSSVCDLGIIGTPVTQCLDLGVLGP